MKDSSTQHATQTDLSPLAQADAPDRISPAAPRPGGLCRRPARRMSRSTFVDENLEEIDFDDRPDVVAISMMLTIQVKRGWEIADDYRRRGVPVIFGGIATMLHAEETMAHADAVFLGEAEGRMEQVFDDLRTGPAATGVRLSGRPSAHRDGRPGPARHPPPRALQLQGRPDGGPGARLAGLPFQLLPLRRGLSGRTQVPAAAHRQSHRRNGRHRQQPPLHRGQFPGPGYRMGNGSLPGDDPPEEEVVLPPHRGQPQGARPGRPGRGLVCLSGGLRHLGLHPRPDQALPRPRHRRGGHHPARPGRAHRRRYQAPDRLSPGDRAGPGRIHGPDALSPHPGLSRTCTAKSASSPTTGTTTRPTRWSSSPST